MNDGEASTNAHFAIQRRHPMVILVAPTFFQIVSCGSFLLRGSQFFEHEQWFSFECLHLCNNENLIQHGQNIPLIHACKMGIHSISILETEYIQNWFVGTLLRQQITEASRQSFFVALHTKSKQMLKIYDCDSQKNLNSVYEGSIVNFGE